MRALQLKLLGHFECSLGKDERISLSMRKADVLLAYLALTPGLRHPRERLINLLWSDRGDEQARNSLRQCLSSIKKSLGEAADLILLVDRTTVSLKPELVEVDAHEFERLALEGDYESLSTAADLYQGEFLEGISIRDPSCQEWLESERGRFKRQHIEILTNLGETQLVTHDFGHAIRSAERLVDQDPLTESSWRLLMRSYFEYGDRNHALMAFKRCSEVLQRELGIEPEAQTVELQQQIMSGQTSATIPAKTDPEMTEAPSIKPAQKLSRGEHSILVLPFDNLSGDPGQEYFSDGITESIIMNLSAFPDLNVKSRNSSFAFKQQIKSLGEISEELDVDYLVEGSIRKSNERVRITVQLIEASSGNQIWGKRYDAEIADLFDLEEDLSRRIAATVTGQIESDLQRIAISRGATALQSYDLLLSGAYHLQKFTPTDMKIAIEKLDRCLELDPENVRAHVDLYYSHAMSWLERWTEEGQSSFNLADLHAHKAISLAPDLASAQLAFAEHMIFCREQEKAANYIEKALATNPNDPHALTMKAFNLETMGEYEAALETANLALQLDPYHPWCDWIVAESEFYCGQYEASLKTLANSKNPPSFTRIVGIAAYLELGKPDQARQALQEFLRSARDDMPLMPGTREEWLKYSTDNTPFFESGVNERLIDYMIQAGLEEELAKFLPTESSDQQPSILVLPFENMSGDPEQEYFSDGVTNSIILGLGMFKGLSVKSRQTSFAFRDSDLPSEQIAKDLSLDYLVEGSIRKSKKNVRISVQLVDAASGSQIWGKQYHEKLDDIFELEQELSQTIAATISGRIGHTLQQSAVRNSAKNLQSYDYLLRGLYHFGKFTARDLEVARQEIRKCIEIDPENATAHTNLGMIHRIEILEGWTTNRTDSDSLALQHLEKALELEPENALAQAFMADYLFAHQDYEQAEFHADKAIELNPTASEGYTAKADILGHTRRIDEAVKYADKCMQLDPHSVGSGWVAGGVYRASGQYTKAIKTFRSIRHAPANIHALVAACFISMELQEEAHKEMSRYLQLAKEQMPVVPRSEKEWRVLWRDNSTFQLDEDFDEFFEILLKAGLRNQVESDSDEIPSIAVLPFENMSGEPEQEHFADGITTDIIATLSKFRHMRTVARYSILQYRDKKTSIADIAGQQNVRYILEGSVRKSGAKIRVSAELIDAQTDQLCWSERYDRDLDDLFKVQDEITRNIALAMKVQMDDGEMALHRSKGATSIKAWELTLVAVDLQETYIWQNILDARAMTREAIELDPDYAYAWITLGWTYWQEAYSGWSDSIEDSIDEAVKANQHAMSLDPNYGEAWIQAGMNHQMRHEREEAIAACLRGVELEPGSAEVHALTAYSYIVTGNYEEARKYEQNMCTLCPIRPNWYYLVSGQIEQGSGNLDLAAEIFQQGLEVEPDSPLCRFYLINVLMEKGHEARAGQLADEIRALDKSITGRGMVHAYSSDPEKRQRFHDNLAKFNLV